MLVNLLNREQCAKINAEYLKDSYKAEVNFITVFTRGYVSPAKPPTLTEISPALTLVYPYSRSAGEGGGWECPPTSIIL